jgi:aminopeptidase
LRAVDATQVDRLARLVVELGTNVQPDQVVAVLAAPEAAPLVAAVAAHAYDRGARFVDAWYVDSPLKRVRAERAREETLDYVPPWYGERMKQLGALHGVRISISPYLTPGLLDGIDPARTGKDQLPTVPESYQVLNEGTTSWCVIPWVTPTWARRVFPDLDGEAALEALTRDVLYTLRLDEDDPVAAWRARFADLERVGAAIGAAGVDAVHFEGPGTDLTIGLLPSSRFVTVASWVNVDGVAFAANLPSEEILTTPDPERADGVISATLPVDVGGVLVEGLRVRFEGGKVVELEAERGADALRRYVAKDEGSCRLGEVALVDREGRVGRTGRLFYNTLLDENAASHLALGNGYDIPVADADRHRINRSAIHVDFMVGSDDVATTGVTADGRRVPILRDGTWQL